jgi:hypothetical protein
MAKTCMGIEMNVWSWCHIAIAISPTFLKLSFIDPTDDDNDDDDNDNVDLANDYQSHQNTTKHGGCLPFCD